MKDTLVYIAQSLVDHPDAVEVEEKTNGDALILVLHVHPDDMGQVIGKSGRIIRAIRDLMKIIATKHDQFVDVELYEEPQKVQDAISAH